MKTPQIFNRALALERLMDDEELLAIILEEYFRTIPSLLTNIDQAIVSCDHTTVFHGAHSIKGASLSIGAEIVGDYAKKLEMAAKMQNLSEYQSLFVQIKDAFEIFTKEYQQEYSS